MHLTLGYPKPDVNHDLVKKVVSKLNPSSARPRLPILPSMLRKVKTGLSKDVSFSRREKRALWAAASTSFHGFLRLGEILASAVRDFQVDLTFCWEDLKLSDKCGSDICPFWAVQQFLLMSVQTPHKPVFVLDSRKNNTRAIMDRVLKHHLAPFISHIYGSVSCHSLRAGAATTAELLGWSKEEIMGAGRWRSDSYNAYVALPQITRINHTAQLSFSACWLKFVFGKVYIKRVFKYVTSISYINF